MQDYPGHVIDQGSSDQDAIIAIKQRLIELGFGPLDPTSTRFGIKTEERVKAFQKANQLVQDGEVGELTWTRLFTVSIIQPPASFVLRLRAVEIADTQLFVRELTGRNDGKEVEQYLAGVGLGKGFAWCMAFVYWSFTQAAKELNIANPVPKTAGVLNCLEIARTMGKKIVQVPEPGDQGIMDFGGGKGHTFLVNELRPGGKVFTVEGNTSADPSYKGEDREGNGVFERNRPINSAIAYIRYF
jgi:hypothetical protein